MNAIVPSSQMTKGEVFRILNTNIPLNQYHLPDHIYRADLVDANTLDLLPDQRAMVLDAAAMPITFDHGYPAILEHKPLWQILPCETEEAFAAFTTYLELPTDTNHENPIRLLPLIAEATRTAIEKITEWCHIYYWHWRGRAYDLFLLAAHRKQREQRIMSIEGKHFTEAESLLTKVVKLAHKKLDQDIRALEEDADAQIDSKLKELVAAAKDLVGIQRISVGLPAMGPSTINLQMDGARHTTVSETFKHIAKEGSGEEAPRQRSAEMDTLLNNPDDLTKVQEMLIRLQRPDHVLPAWGTGEIIDVTPESTGKPNPGPAANDVGEGRSAE